MFSLSLGRSIFCRVILTHAFAFSWEVYICIWDRALFYQMAKNFIGALYPKALGFEKSRRKHRENGEKEKWHSGGGRGKDSRAITSENLITVAETFSIAMWRFEEDASVHTRRVSHSSCSYTHECQSLVKLYQKLLLCPVPWSVILFVSTPPSHFCLFLFELRLLNTCKRFARASSFRLASSNRSDSSNSRASPFTMINQAPDYNVTNCRNTLRNDFTNYRPT